MSPHSAEARAIADLFDQTLIVCGVLFVVVAAPLAWALVRFRARGTQEPPQLHGSTRLEIAWTIGPLLVVAWLFALSVRAVGASDPPTDHEPDVVVVAHQWWWEARYPSGAITANEIHVPAGKRLVAEIRSEDVIHDFWVPQLARKVDATPGHPVRIWLSADAPGTYDGACAEFCGAQHAWMRITVVAQPEQEYEAWLRHQLEPASVTLGVEATRGARFFREHTCAECHHDGPAPGPNLRHMGARTTLAAGLLDNTPENLSRWLADPQALKPNSHMPSLQLRAADVDDLVAYLEGSR